MSLTLLFVVEDNIVNQMCQKRAGLQSGTLCENWHFEINDGIRQNSGRRVFFSNST